MVSRYTLDGCASTRNKSIHPNLLTTIHNNKGGANPSDKPSIYIAVVKSIYSAEKKEKSRRNHLPTHTIGNYNSNNAPT